MGLLIYKYGLQTYFKVNKSIHQIAGVSAVLKCFGLTNIIITNKSTGKPLQPVILALGNKYLLFFNIGEPMKKLAISAVMFLFLYGCTSYFHLSKDQFLQQAVTYQQKSEATASFSTFTPAGWFFFSSRYDANNMEKILCYNDRNELVYLYPDQNTQLEFTSKSTGDVIKMYFNTVFLEGPKIVGLRSRLITSMTREIEIEDIADIKIYAEFPSTEKANQKY